MNEVEREPAVVAGAPGFAEFYEAQLDRQVRRAFLMVGSNELANDIVHDAMVEVYRRWDDVERPAAYLLLARLQGLVTHPAPVWPSPGECEAQKRPSPRPIHRTFGRIDRQLQAPLQEPRHTGQHPLVSHSRAFLSGIPRVHLGDSCLHRNDIVNMKKLQE